MTVDDHPIFRDGFAALLAFYKDLELVAEASDGAQAVAMVRTHKPDVVLMDLSMPVMGGAQATDAITSEFPDGRIIALTTYEVTRHLSCAGGRATSRSPIRSAERKRR